MLMLAKIFYLLKYSLHDILLPCHVSWLFDVPIQISQGWDPPPPPPPRLLSEREKPVVKWLNRFIKIIKLEERKHFRTEKSSDGKIFGHFQKICPNLFPPKLIRPKFFPSEIFRT